MFLYDSTDTFGDDKLAPQPITEPYKVSRTTDNGIIDRLKESLSDKRINVLRRLDIKMQQVHDANITTLTNCSNMELPAVLSVIHMLQELVEIAFSGNED